MNKECEICGAAFVAKQERRKLCDKCQKNPAQARVRMEKAIKRSKSRLGELPHQQYHNNECEYCEQDFVSYGYKRKFCSPACRKQHAVENALCRKCGKPLFPLGIIIEGTWGYCSDTCKTASAYDRAKEQGRVRQCYECGKEFVSKNHTQAYCNASCYRAYKDKEIASRPVPAAPAIVTAICEVCGARFERHKNATQYTCGVNCRKIRADRKRQTAKEVGKSAAKRSS